MTLKRRLVAVFSLLLLVFLSRPDGVLATRFTYARLRFDRIKAAQNSALQVKLVPATTAVEDSVRMIFDSTIMVGTSLGVSVTNIDSGSTELPGTLTVAGSGSSITVSGVTNLTVGTTYMFNIIGGGLTTPSASGVTNVVTTLGAGTTIDSTVVLSRFITDDQIIITANVPPTFTFVLSGTSDTFTTDLSSSSVVSTNGKTVTVTTNAAKGWTGWVKSANAALLSATTGESIGTTGSLDQTPSTCQVGTDCYVLDADLTTSGSGSGSLTIDAEYLGADTSSGGTLSTTLQRFAYRTGKTAGDVITFLARASMLATKAAGGDYTDTLTIIGAGNF